MKNNIENQIKSDMMEFVIIFLYTIFIFIFGFAFAHLLLVFVPKEQAQKPIQYILPESPSGMYCSNKHYSF